MRSYERYLWLGRMSVGEWLRFFNTEYVEVIFRGLLADEVRCASHVFFCVFCFALLFWCLRGNAVSILYILYVLLPFFVFVLFCKLRPPMETGPVCEMQQTNKQTNTKNAALSDSLPSPLPLPLPPPPSPSPPSFP